MQQTSCNRRSRKETLLTSLMLAEAAASGAAVARQLATIDQALAALADDLRAQPPQLALTVARGSSDHAASHSS